MAIPEAPFVDKRGAQRTWQELHMQLQRLLRKRFPDVDGEILADSVSEAVLDLMGRWASLDSSHANADQWRFGYALQRGMHTAATYVRGACRTPEVPYTFGVGPQDVADEHHGLEPGFSENRTGYFTDFADTSPGPDELVEEADEMERARRMLAQMPAEELAECFVLLEQGTTREIGERLGVSAMTVSRKQRAGRDVVKNSARKYGLELISV